MTPQECNCKILEWEKTTQFLQQIIKKRGEEETQIKRHLWDINQMQVWALDLESTNHWKKKVWNKQGKQENTATDYVFG